MTSKVPMKPRGQLQVAMSVPDGAAPIRAVFFDVGQTLLRVRGSVGAIYAETAARHGIRADSVELDRRFRSAWARSVERSSAREFRCSDEALRDEWLAIVGDTFPEGVEPSRLERVFEELYEHFSSPAAWCLVPRARETLETLRALGVRRIVVSNWDSRLRRLLGDLGLEGAFDDFVISYEVGFEKPHPEVFREALRRAGTRPSETLHIGDSWDADILPALALGLRVLWVARPEEPHRDPRVPRIEGLPADPAGFWAARVGRVGARSPQDGATA